MKIALRLLSLLLLAGFAVLNVACDGGDDPGKSQEEQQFDKLKKSWVLTSATLDGDDRTADFSGVVLSVASGNTFSQDGTYSYSFSGTMPAQRSPWPRSGQWEFGDDPLTQIVRDPGTPANELSMEYVVTDADLQITFTVPGSSDGWSTRTQAVSGEWVFNFDAQ
jgi:hypothetical protein